jgi:negative regulator of sigma E activity
MAAILYSRPLQLLVAVAVVVLSHQLGMGQMVVLAVALDMQHREPQRQDQQRQDRVITVEHPLAQLAQVAVAVVQAP